MRTDIVMPRWANRFRGHIPKAQEPGERCSATSSVEISTDKVDAEIPERPPRVSYKT